MSPILLLPIAVLVLGALLVARLAARVRAELAAVDRGLDGLAPLGQALGALAQAAAIAGAAQDRLDPGRSAAATRVLRPEPRK